MQESKVENKFITLWDGPEGVGMGYIGRISQFHCASDSRQRVSGTQRCSSRDSVTRVKTIFFLRISTRGSFMWCGNILTCGGRDILLCLCGLLWSALTWGVRMVSWRREVRAEGGYGIETSALLILTRSSPGATACRSVISVRGRNSNWPFTTFLIFLSWIDLFKAEQHQKSIQMKVTWEYIS